MQSIALIDSLFPSFSESILPPDMDACLRTAARTGNVNELYELIESDGNVLRRIDEVEFIETPLHVAAENGCIGFAMEIMSLKPSFARKLNHRGLSPLHLAIEKGHKEMALRLVGIDKDLVRVRGKNGETPLHYLCKVENRHDLLNRFLEACPECIGDVTAQNHSALHIAVKNNRLDVLQVLIRSLRKNDYYQELVNRQDEDGNTALHIATTSNQHQIFRLLLKCKADKHVTNLADETALDVAHHTESISVLRGGVSPAISNSTYELKKKIVNHVTKTSLLFFHGIDNISSDDRSSLLVILGLLLTATYQASLSPPGGVWQGDNYTNSSSIRTPGKPGTSVMNQSDFLYFYIPTYVVFIIAFFLTLTLLRPFPSGFRIALQVLLAFIAACFDQSIYILAPTDLAYLIINIFSGIIFIMMVFMCIVYQVSKLSVSIVGCCLFPSIFSFFGLQSIGDAFQGLLVFIFLHDEFWKGTILVLGFSLFVNMYSDFAYYHGVAVFIGTWLFLNLCRIIIKHCTRCCNE